MLYGRDSALWGLDEKACEKAKAIQVGCVCLSRYGRQKELCDATRPRT